MPNLQVLQECCLYGADLALAICGCMPDGAADFKVQEAFRVVLEDDEEDADSMPHSSRITLQCLWAVLDAWSVDRRRAFVKFVTGTDRQEHAYAAASVPLLFQGVLVTRGPAMPDGGLGKHR